MTAPLRFAFGLHLHQPVGNFGWVFEHHLAAVYRPLLERMIGGGWAPVSLHVSGPLLDWLEEHAGAFLDDLGRAVSDGRIELLLAGYDEPILAVLPREDRLEQIGRMREALRRRFGVNAEGLWLTERVWEPDVAGDLHDAGVRYALVDDRHFLVAGFERPDLHRPWLTEHGGRTLTLFPIDERLRYLVPFGSPTKLREYLRQLRADGHRLAVLADDGEKFGGWPGTREWVYEKGWLRDVLGMLADLRERGEIELVTFGQVLASVPPDGPAYLPSASYREMERWALPSEAGRRLDEFEAELGDARLEEGLGSLVRGSHWRHFLVKYAESNRMHQTMLTLSALCRERGDPPAARRAIGRAQCNDAYWHGVFGGLYLPHLRHAIWRELSAAEAYLRKHEGLEHEIVDVDCDGRDEIWIHGSRASLVVSPARGGSIERWTVFESGRNYADVLTRRRESYHQTDRRTDGPTDGGSEDREGGVAGIHDLEQDSLRELPPVDPEPRAILQERIWPASTSTEDLAAARVPPLRSWALEPARFEPSREGDSFRLHLLLEDLEKLIRLEPDGSLSVELGWTRPEDAPPDAWFTTELSLGHPAAIAAPGAVLWRYPIETVAKSERGLDRTVQGESVTLAWPLAAGRAAFRIVPDADRPEEPA